MIAPNISLAELTNDQPFCAGVLVLDERGRMLVTLNDEARSADGSLHVIAGGVGGGQEPGENILQTAMREAEEEIGTMVELEHSETTYFHDIDARSLETLDVIDRPAPILFERKRNANPDVPFKPGLPAGPFTYFAIYRARPLGPVVPVDVAGVMMIPPALWPELAARPTLGDLLDAGASSPDAGRLRDHRLLVDPDESFSTLARILAESPGSAATR